MKTIVCSDPSHQILLHRYQKVHYFQENYCDLKIYTLMKKANTQVLESHGHQNLVNHWLGILLLTGDI